MRSQTEAVRALAYYVAGNLDVAHRHENSDAAKKAQAFVDLLTPVVKAWSTDVGVDVANTGIQIHGGMGFIEETGAAQHFRDARIAPIYEGTNGIQANDLAARKIGREGGVTAKQLISEMRASLESMASSHARMSSAIDALERATDWIVETYEKDPETALAGAVPYLRLMGITVGGWLMVRSLEIVQQKRDQYPDFADRKLASVRYFARYTLTEAEGLAIAVTEGSSSITQTALKDL